MAKIINKQVDLTEKLRNIVKKLSHEEGTVFKWKENPY